MEINKGLRRLSAPSSRKVPDYLRIIIREEVIVPKVHDATLMKRYQRTVCSLLDVQNLTACTYKQYMERI